MLYLFRRFNVTIIFCTFASTVTLADNRHVPCPNVELIRNSADALNEATLVNHTYIANTPPFAIHTTEQEWFAVVYNIQAINPTDALSNAKATMRSVRSLDHADAINAGGIYICDYDNRKVEVINNEVVTRRNN
jgi:hypothetical protein